MPDNNILRPPAFSGGSRDVDMSLICEATGLPVEHLTLERIATRLMPSIVATFTDGEVKSIHDRDTDPVSIEHFGETNFEDGTFGSRLRELLGSDDETLRRQTDNLIRHAAYLFTQNVVEQRISLPSKHMADINTARSTLTFDGQTIPLAEPPQTVVDYGPGLQGRFHIRRQIMDLNEGRVPYSYFALAKGPFINEFLMEYWMARSSREFFRHNVLGRLYMGREDGLASASTEMITVQTKHAGAAAMADIVLASGVHTAGFGEVEKGIQNAHTLLKPDGILLVRAPKSTNDKKLGVVSAEAMVGMADVVGFDTNKAQYFDVMTGPGDTPTVQALAAVFRK